jgi:hypothetical protein
LKKFFIATISISGLFILVAIASLLIHDHKVKKWYNESAINHSQQHMDSTTILCILATVHIATANYNADSIVSILENFQPDLILTEEDTLIFETYHNAYNKTLQRPVYARLKASFGFGYPEQIEDKAVRKYKIRHPAVGIRPFDIEDRNLFYRRNSTFSKEKETGEMLAALAADHSMSPQHAQVWKVYNQINDTLDQRNNQTPYSINQPSFYNLTERRQFYQYQKVADIVNGNDRLKPFRDWYKTNADFWDTRNKKMAAHIANFIRLFPNKRIIVLTGSMHKYFLLKELTPLQNQLNFRLKEYYE